MCVLCDIGTNLLPFLIERKNIFLISCHPSDTFGITQKVLKKKLDLLIKQNRSDRCFKSYVVSISRTIDNSINRINLKKKRKFL